MMKYILLIITSILVLHSLADTLTVKQDGTGDYTIIQDAVNAAAFGDTVLVWPGTYYEHVKFTNRDLCLGSLTLTTGDNSYIAQTTIDGNCNDTTWFHSCITIRDTVSNFEVNGFTIQNGTGYQDSGGGGLSIGYSNGAIKNCIIQDNYVKGSGGGFAFGIGDLYLSNVTIRNNHACEEGGGIVLNIANLLCDTIHKCSIYGNYAPNGTDIFKMFGDTLHFVVDTFTVQNPDNFFISSVHYPYGYQMNDITIETSNGYFSPIASDIYVSPSGNNSNSGLSPNEPLKNIYYAYLLSDPDSINPQNIYLDEGMYSFTNNEEWLPICGRSYINLIGSSKENCIIDAENKLNHVFSRTQNHDITYQNMTMKNANGNYAFTGFQVGSLYLNRNENVVVKNILFKNNRDKNASSIRLLECNNIIIEECDIIDGVGRPVRIGTWGDEFGTDSLNFSNSHHSFVNCRFEGNRPSQLNEYGWNSFTASISTGVDIDTLSIDLIGCLFADNIDSTRHPYYSRGSLSLEDVDANIINCTFANNQANNSQLGASFNTNLSSNINVYNCIFYNNEPSEIAINTVPGSTPYLNIYNSLVMEGEAGVLNNTGGVLYYDNTNIDTNPLFYEGWEYPYNLSDNSPCIDAGTLDIPDWIELPEFDLAGNPRIHNGEIDMGAYEWDPTVGIGEHLLVENDIDFDVYPNPANTSTIINYHLSNDANVEITVFDSFGRHISTLLNSTQHEGFHTLQWNLTGSNGERLKNGIYILKLQMDDITVSKKVVIN